MAIQFHCPGCRQPIEIDDEFGGQSVTCPYCQREVNAPRSSQPIEASAVPPPPGMSSGVSAPPPPMPANWFATTGMVLGLGVLLCLLLAGVFMAPMANDMQPLQGTTPTQQQIQEIMEKHAGPVLSGTVMMFLGVACGVVGLVFSILGLTKRPGRKWQAVVGLILCILPLGCVCLSGIAAMAGAAGS